VADCPKCGRANTKEIELCAGCGAGLAEGDAKKRTTLVPPSGAPVPPSIVPLARPVFCPECGASISPGLAFCGRCGNKVGQ
jgi:predicted amidophosphoribosyltransferase